MKRFGTDSRRLPVQPKASLKGSVKIQKLMNTYQMSSLPWCWWSRRGRSSAGATDAAGRRQRRRRRTAHRGPAVIAVSLARTS